MHAGDEPCREGSVYRCGDDQLLTAGATPGPPCSTCVGVSSTSHATASLRYERCSLWHGLTPQDLILGGGFGGVYTAMALKALPRSFANVDITW
jgi:hypothetical protein